MDVLMIGDGGGPAGFVTVKMDDQEASIVLIAAAERVRGREMAEKLQVSVLSRAWQIALKGLGEAQVAPAALPAVEMVLIRLAHAAELPTPGDIVRRLQQESAAPAAAGAAPSNGAGGTAAGGNGGGAPG
ncbi:MAG: DNA polymerase III subunit gamma/tau, partial [Alphaproteobacteria bacterium]